MLFDINESQKLLEGIAGSIPGLAYLVNYQTNEIVYHNHQAKELLGYSDAEIEALGANFIAILIHPEDRELDFQQWQAVMKDSTISTKKNDGETWSLQMRLRDREGYYKWFLVRQAIYERDDQGKVLLGRGLALDIHESKLTEELLHLTEERLRFLLEASPVV
ncbi:MAG: PAS domain-containing protein, partial [Microcystaceae cyanobacterium]